MAEESQKLLVVAIDFGTTYSGYAFSFRHEFELNPLKISTNTSWHSSSGQGMMSMKTPTTVLLNPDQTFNSFGFEAEDRYMELAEEEKHEPWYYFRRFKMLLFRKLVVNREVMIEEATGKKMKAIVVFSMAIEYLKDQCMSLIRARGLYVKDDDVMWVLSVPAIWEEPAKQFMREAAVMAKIPSGQLKLVLEPEAASVLCKTIPLERNGEDQYGPFNEGTKYLVLDLGGGTVDVTVHEVKDDGTLKEIKIASGGAWGGTRVDDAYVELFNNLFGKVLMNEFRRLEKIEDLDMQRNFELKKREVKNDTTTMNITVPAALLEFVEEHIGKRAQECIKTVVGDAITLKRNRLILKGHIMCELFKESINGVIEHVKGILSDPKVGRVDKILMVGGFSECAVVANAVRGAFPSIQTVAPPEAGLAVLKGAVIFGHSPQAIASRVMHLTYGVAVRDIFNPELHPVENQEKCGDVLFCRDTFDKFFATGDEVGNDETIVREYAVVERSQAMEIAVFASENPNPVLVTEEGCTKIGTIVIKQPLGGWRKNSTVLVELGLGGSEFTVKVTESMTQLQQEASFDFLSNN